MKLKEYLQDCVFYEVVENHSDGTPKRYLVDSMPERDTFLDGKVMLYIKLVCNISGKEIHPVPIDNVDFENGRVLIHSHLEIVRAVDSSNVKGIGVPFDTFYKNYKHGRLLGRVYSE